VSLPQISAPGQTGFIELPNSIGCPPESLQRIAQYLSNAGFTSVISEGNLLSRQLPRGVLSTTTGWLLTWSSPARQINGGLASFGRLWVAAGVDDSVIPFTTT